MKQIENTLFEKRVLRYRKAIHDSINPTTNTAKFFNISMDTVYDIMDKSVNEEIPYCYPQRPIVIGVLKIK